MATQFSVVTDKNGEMAVYIDDTLVENVQMLEVYADVDTQATVTLAFCPGATNVEMV